MATPVNPVTWLTVTPGTGSGNANLSNSATVHTGRTVRTATVTVTASGVATPATYGVTQTAKTEFVSFDNGSSMSAGKAAATITITGLSNSTKLKYEWVGDAVGATLASKYTAGGLEIANDGSTVITGDPGASAQYACSMAVSIPLNDTISTISRTLKVTANGGQTAQIVITQAAGDPRISVSPASITIPAAGTAQTVTVSSNTSWTVS